MPPAATVTPKHLLTEGTPAEIRDAILPEDRERFDDGFRRALDTAARTLSLDELDACLSHWRRAAAQQVHMGHDAYRAMLAEIDRRLAGGPPPPGMVSQEEMETRLQARLAAG